MPVTLLMHGHFINSYKNQTGINHKMISLANQVSWTSFRRIGLARSGYWNADNLPIFYWFAKLRIVTLKKGKTPNGCLLYYNDFFVYVLLELTFHLNNKATPYAAPAASAPISITFKAPDSTGTPVILLLKYPNTNKQIRVAITDNLRASFESLMKK